MVTERAMLSIKRKEMFSCLDKLKQSTLVQSKDKTIVATSSLFALRASKEFQNQYDEALVQFVAKQHLSLKSVSGEA